MIQKIYSNDDEIDIPQSVYYASAKLLENCFAQPERPGDEGDVVLNVSKVCQQAVPWSVVELLAIILYLLV